MLVISAGLTKYLSEKQTGKTLISCFFRSSLIWVQTVCLDFCGRQWLFEILFDLILYVPVNIFSVMSGRVFLGWTSTKQGLTCLAQGHKTVTPVRLKPANTWSWVKHSTTALPMLEILEHLPYEPWHEISNIVVCATSKGSDQPAHMLSLIRAFASSLNILWILGYWLNIIWGF